MKVLLTGAAGFIGSHVAEALYTAGYGVVGLDLRTGADIRDDSALDQRLVDVDAVVHQAAKVGLGVDVTDLPGYASVNVYGTAVLLAAMARHGVGRLVLASSMVVYGEGAYACAEHGWIRPMPRAADDLARGLFEPRCPRCGSGMACVAIDEDAPTDPRNAYATTKLAQEHLAANWARETGGVAVALRYHNVYGPRMPRDTPYSGVAAIFRSALEAGCAPRVFEDGGQRRDFVHVRDVAQANVAALAGRRPGMLTAYNIASGEPHTVGEMAAALAAQRGGPEPVITGEYRLGDVRHIVASLDKASHELGFRAQVGFADGMREFATAPLGRSSSPQPPA
ncbi:NAD-dependent epimerase/dehydratase family protein [Actinomadura alba]|uniref:NAD-dependent epimerase/dehydratase family protein n=1 Tax=Actinomadura alba TaxID=406431 RepID=A0ABR7LTS9_9ACTN|nr:NAD-dependent epimerase/dehydratase family protein [Actinomadura alba]MBC6467875.1 NAD-dependent epimerase/dehydratase family protein [Actinomadura alba]